MAEALIDRELLEKLERLSLRWLRSYRGVLGGHNRSRLPGYGHEFLDHRNFYPGDDLRAVNWRAYLRFERFLLKTFELEPRVPIRLLLDASASMGVGGKFFYARRLALALIYIALVKLDTVSLHHFAKSLSRPVQATGGRQCIHELERFLRLAVCAGETDFHTVVRSFLSAYQRPGLVIVVSDFFGEQDDCEALQNLADFGHELLLVQVWAREDRNPELNGPIELIDSETGRVQRLEVDADASGRYRARVEQQSKALRRLAARNGGRYVDVCTGTPLEEALFGPVRTVIGQG